jgi:c-di-GMP-binding flagellar brake protein YcgR
MTRTLLMEDVELAERPRVRIEDQRRASRKEIRLVAQIELPDASLLHGQTADISRAGIGFFSPQPIAIGGDCTLTIEIFACGTRAVLKLIGRVCHCTKQSEDCFRIGMKFIRMDEQTATILCSALR